MQLLRKSYAIVHDFLLYNSYIAYTMNKLVIDTRIINELHINSAIINGSSLTLIFVFFSWFIHTSCVVLTWFICEHLWKFHIKTTFLTFFTYKQFSFMQYVIWDSAD